MNWTYFPKNQRMPKELELVAASFDGCKDLISSYDHKLNSNEVLEIVKPKL